MELLVIDLETSGLGVNAEILEIGLVYVNTETKEIRVLFDNLIKEPGFNPNKFPKPWIFQNSNLRPGDVMKAESLEHYRDELQGYFDKYPVTAFNSKFDFKFMTDRKFDYKPIKCIMMSTKPYFQLKNKVGGWKFPSVMETYAQLFPDETYDEKHRGADDAVHEAKILLEMVNLKENKKVID